MNDPHHWPIMPIVSRTFRLVLIASMAALLGGAAAIACPFCDVAAQTLSEESASSDVEVLARQIEEAKPVSEADDPNSGTAKFEVVEVLRGKEILGDTKQIDVVYFGEFDKDRVFRIVGMGTEKPDWTTPLPLSPAAVEYVRQLPTVPATGMERLLHFQQYLEHEDPLLAQDSYDEFARADYAHVLELAPKMDHDQLVKWISDLEINPSRRRLYLTMLGACGGKDDLPLLESMIVPNFEAVEPHLKQAVNFSAAIGGPLSLPVWLDVVEQRERQKKLGLDALVACYLKLRGPDGLDLIDERFLKTPKTDYTHVYSTLMALRFHGDQHTDVLPKERLLASMRLLLDNPDFADQVILDLSRWEDWSVLDRLVEMFKTSDKKGYVRQPVVTYLTVAADIPGDVGTRARAAMAELESLDPETVKQARSLMAFGALSRARAGGDSAVAADGKTADATSPAAEGYAASGESETDPADIADPAAYEKPEGASAVAPKEQEGAQAVKTAKPVDEAAKGKSAAVFHTTSPVAAATKGPEPILLVGVPLVAAGLLMGVYWAILRLGAL
jgi:hypothetical protein